MSKSRITRRSTIARAAAAIAATGVLLAGCGGDDGPAGPTVSSATVDATRYGATALVTINGTRLDAAIVVASAGCKDMTRLTAAPDASTATTAWYRCTVSGATASSVAVTFDGRPLGSASFSVPAPVVTMAVSNGADIQGDLVITLDPDSAPNTVDNFLGYVNSGVYDGTIFDGVSRLAFGYGYLAGFKKPGATFDAAPDLPQPHPLIPLETIVPRTDDVSWSVGVFPMNQDNGPTMVGTGFFINRDNDDSTLNRLFGQLSPASVPLMQKMDADCPGLYGDYCFLYPNLVITRATQTQ